MSVKNRGFASLSQERRQQLAQRGGWAARDKGVGHHWTPEQAKAASEKGLEKRRQRRLERQQELEAAKQAIADMIAEGGPVSDPR